MQKRNLGKNLTNNPNLIPQRNNKQTKIKNSSFFKSFFYIDRFWIAILLYLLVILILPIFALVNKSWGFSETNFWEIALHPIAIKTYQITFLLSFLATCFNGFFGFIITWVLTRYNFYGKKFLDALIDLPFAIPTSVAGLAISTIYNENIFLNKIGSSLNIELTFIKMFSCLVFVSLPFTIRSLQPVLEDFDKQIEEAAWCLGTSEFETFYKVILPNILPSFFIGLTLSFSRAIGEYGSLVVVSSNIPYKDLTSSVLIAQRIEQYDYEGATIIGIVMLTISLILLLSINLIQSWSQLHEN
uniref:Sulfate ABC transporter permease subunit CysT n=1 Tax=Olisthodiscus luteus TaxID=83000 RepID=A0A7U0KRS4_OLILU|nr:sulfate ABC transporter permease subunit CysT [Olisthodiscus luteus]QQW50480.1 sulfate ABC transporter permease subunit CysT [Olisthodiscus luteus]